MSNSNVETYIKLVHDKDFSKHFDVAQLVKVLYWAIQRDHIERRLASLVRKDAKLLEKLRGEMDILILRQDLADL